MEQRPAKSPFLEALNDPRRMLLRAPKGFAGSASYILAALAERDGQWFEPYYRGESGSVPAWWLMAAEVSRAAIEADAEGVDRAFAMVFQAELHQAFLVSMWITGAFEGLDLHELSDENVKLGAVLTRAQELRSRRISPPSSAADAFGLAQIIMGDVVSRFPDTRDVARVMLLSAAMNGSLVGRSLTSQWARSVMISYAHEDDEWMRTALRFCDLLQECGIDAIIDQYDNYRQRLWTLWGPQEVQARELVLCLASPQYFVRWNQVAGSGVSDEARAVREKFASDVDSVCFVLLPGRDRGDIPFDFRGLHYLVVDWLDREGLANVVRKCGDRPLNPPPPLGERPAWA